MLIFRKITPIITQNNISMKEKEIYLTPETEEITLCLEKTVLDVSTTTDTSTGEDAILDAIINPW